MFLDRIAQLPVPAGKCDALDLGESECCREVKAVVGTQAMTDCRFCSGLDDVGGHRMDVDPPPDSLEVPESIFEPARRYAASVSHPR